MPLMSRGASRWFYNVLTYDDGEVIDCWIFFSLKIHLNQNSKLKGNLGALMILLESTHCGRFNEIYLENFRARRWEILNFECFLSLKIQFNYQKINLKGKFSWVSIEFWVLFIIEYSIKLQKRVSKGKFSWVTSSHLAQEQKTTLVII
jgi:hypothetical protein